MIPRTAQSRLLFRIFVGALALILLIPTSAMKAQPRIDVLQIGSTSNLTGKNVGPVEKSGHEMLQRFIKNETKMDSVLQLLRWQELVDKMEKGIIHVAFLQGHEFAWAQEKHPNLKPLALAINGDLYPVAIVVVQRDNLAKDFPGLKGQSVAVTELNSGFLRLFMDRQCEAIGKSADTFFSRTISAANFEDALDDVIEGKAQATLIDQSTLDGYKRRKPGRFKMLREVVRSQPFLPRVVAYHALTMDADTRKRLQDTLLGADRNGKAELLLTLSQLTSFKTVPADFDQRLVEFRKAYPNTSTK